MNPQFSSLGYSNNPPPNTANRPFNMGLAGKNAHGYGSSAGAGAGRDGSQSQSLQRRDTNPFRRNQASRAPPDPGFQEQELHGATSKYAPTKAVFNDLSTAHSLITTGSARSGQSSKAGPDLRDNGDENAIPLQDFNGPNPRSRFHAQPTSQPPPVLPALPNRATSIINTVKTALASMSSPSHGADQESSSTPYGEHNYWQMEEGNDLRSSLNYLGNDYSIYHSSLGAAPSGSAPMSSRFGEGSMLREGSTVTNIYRHYVPSEPTEEVMLEKAANKPQENQEQAKSGMARLGEDSVGEPPKFALPADPSRGGLQNKKLLGVSHGIMESSSYGDTRNLLQMTQPNFEPSPQPPPSPQAVGTMSRSDAFTDLRSDYGVSASTAVDTDTNTPEDENSPSNNPFRASQAPGVVISNTEGENRSVGESEYDLSLNDRVPLERDVSNALRRASGYSTYSLGSLDGDETGTGHSWILEQRLDYTPPLDMAEADNDTQSSAARAQGFYETNVVSDTWKHTHQHSNVRVPINNVNKNKALPASPPQSPKNNAGPSHTRNRQTTDSIQDWETVRDSVLGAELPGGMLGGTAHRAGSSIANTSDNGSISDFVPEISTFSSTDRITQHPAPIDYAVDYRERDLKNTRIPVFLPVFRDHKINGFLSDSNRVRPTPGMMNETPQPYTGNQRHPFKYTPPNIARSSNSSGVQSSLKARMQRKKLANYFPPTPRGDPRYQQQNGKEDSTVTTSVEADGEWMDDFGDPGPAITTQPIQKQPSGDEDETTYRPKSWLNIMNFINGGSLPGSADTTVQLSNQAADPRKEQSGRADGIILQELSKPEKSFAKGMVSNDPNFNQGPGTFNNGMDNEKSFAKAPPGSFYQGLLRKSSGYKDRSQRKPSRTYPTNSLRPFSLLSTEPTQSTLTGHRYSAMPPGEFVYRSPLAPVKRENWKMLYSPSQRELQRQRAKADGFSAASQSSLNPASPTRSSQIRLGAPPTLYLPRDDDSVTSREKKKKQFLSNMVFALCNIFPPLLGLYAWGYLDGFMIFISRGDFSSFGRGQKRWAARALFIWLIVVILGLSIGLGVYFKNLHH